MAEKNLGFRVQGSGLRGNNTFTKWWELGIAEGYVGLEV